MLRTRITCAEGHSTVIAGEVKGGEYRSMEDADWMHSDGGAPIRCPCGAETEDIEFLDYTDWTEARGE